MSLEDDIKIWNKFGSDAEVENSEIGEDGIIVGTLIYEAGEFGLGTRSNLASNRVEFPDTDIGPNQLLCAVWGKPVGWSIVNGAASSGSRSIMNWQVGSHRLNWYFDSAGFRGNTRGGSNGDWLVTDASFDVADGEKFSLIIVMNRAGIDGGPDTVRIYFNGNLVLSSTTVYGPLVGSANFKILVRCNSGGTPLDPFTGVLDNPKFTLKTDQDTIDAIIANINTEGFTEECENLDLEIDQCIALNDIKGIVDERGGAIKIILRDEADVTRDKYNSIKKRAQNTVLEFNAYPIDFSPSQRQLEKAGLRESSDVTVWTAMLDWNNNGVTFEDIEFSGKTTVQLNGVTYEVREKNVVSQIGNVYGYLTLGLFKK